MIEKNIASISLGCLLGKYILKLIDWKTEGNKQKNEDQGLKNQQGPC